MPERPAGTLGGGGTRTYEFTATLPESGEPSFQNAVQGASTTVAYSWVPSEAGREAPENSGGQQRESNGGVRGDGALLDLTVPRIKGSVRRGWLAAWTNCTMSCRLRVRGRLRATSATTSARRVAKVRWTPKAVYPPDRTVSASPSPARCAPRCERPRPEAPPRRHSLHRRRPLRRARRGSQGGPSASAAPNLYPKTIDQQLNLVVNRSIF
jgi:hypothetical protein